MSDTLTNEPFLVTRGDLRRAWSQIPKHQREGSSKTQGIDSTVSILDRLRDATHLDEFPGVDVETTDRIRGALEGYEGEYDLFAIAEVLSDLEELDGFGKVHTARLTQVGAKVVDMAVQK